MALVTFDGNGAVTGVFALPQDFPTTQIADNDARLTAFYAYQALPATYAEKLIAGLAITSTGTPAVNATYPLDSTTWVKLQATALYIQVNSKFPANLTAMTWPDVTGTPKSFPNTTVFMNFASAIGDYVTALVLAYQTLMAGGSASWPTPSATIA